MAKEIATRQCPSCIGPLHYSETTGRLECDYCGKSFTVAEIDALYAAQEAAAAAETADKKAKAEKKAAKNAQPEQAPEQAQPQTPWDFTKSGSKWEEDAGGVCVYSCPACGAEMICESTTVATNCPYCGNNTIVGGKLGGALRPDYVIPFKLDKKAAMAALKKHYRGRILLPGKFKSDNQVSKIQGVYVPFWLFDGEVHADVDFDATVSSTHRQGDYEITETKHYTCNRSGTLNFERLPVDASAKMSDDYMDSIEPYDYGELKPFSTAYLPGFMADKYDVTPANCAERADVRAAQSAVEALTKTVTGYQTCKEIKRRVTLNPGKVGYALLPVWVLNTKWQNKDYVFAMNGQTGKLVGELPISKSRSWWLFAAVFAAVALIMALLCLT